MRRFLEINVLAGLMAAAVGGMSAASKPDRVGQVGILHLGDRSAAPIRFCSRSTRLAGFWKAGRADVVTCERVAATYLRPSTERLPRNVGAYNRQYLGIERDGRRVLYLNAFYTGHEVGPTVMEVLVNACDGGDTFWGLVCDPATGKISEFASNND